MIKRDKAFAAIVTFEIIAILFAAFGIWIAYTNDNIEVSYYDVKDDLIPDEFDGFKIAHVSDLHNRDWDGRAEDLIAAEKPDIIVVTGDMVDSSDRYFDNSLNFLKEAVKIAPVYYVSGKMTISSNSELGDVKEVISVFSTGKDMTILFNSKYLLDCMKVIDDQFIKLSLTNPTSPSTITPVEGDGYLYMILPLRGGFSR